MWTIANYINAARILLQDTVAGAYRYQDDTFKLALDMAFDEAQRLRPDMFIRMTVPVFMSSAMDVQVPVPPGYRNAFVFYITGWVTLEDEEDVTDARASAFMNKFTSQLLTTAS